MEINKIIQAKDLIEAKQFADDNDCSIKSVGFNEFKIVLNHQKTLEELKINKIIELKRVRDEYKTTLIIKDNITYWDCDIENNDGKYNNYNITNCICGWTSINRDLFLNYTETIANKYNLIKNNIITCNTKEELDNLLITFEE